MNCEICQLPAAKNLVICADTRCAEARQKLFELQRKYAPTNGCDNCWSDVRECSEQCRKEFLESSKLSRDLWSIIRIMYPKKEKI